MQAEAQERVCVNRDYACACTCVVPVHYACACTVQHVEKDQIDFFSWIGW